MYTHSRLTALGLTIFLAAVSSASGQGQYIGYVYPAGGQQGSTFPIRLGGQGLIYASDVVVSGEGVSARLVDYYRGMDNQELDLLRKQLTELKKKDTAVVTKDGDQYTGVQHEPTECHPTTPNDRD